MIIGMLKSSIKTSIHQTPDRIFTIYKNVNTTSHEVRQDMKRTQCAKKNRFKSRYDE